MLFGDLTADEEAQVRANASKIFSITPGAGTSSSLPALEEVLANPFAPLSGVDVGGALAAPPATPWWVAPAVAAGVGVAAFMLWRSATTLAGR